MDGLLDEQPGSRRAELALAVEDRVDRASRGGVDVGVGEDDVGRFPAELHRDAFDGAGRGAEDGLARLRLAGERDLVDARVLGHRLADDGARSREDVEGAGRQADVAVEVERRGIVAKPASVFHPVHR